MKSQDALRERKQEFIIAKCIIHCIKKEATASENILQKNIDFHAMKYFFFRFKIFRIRLFY